MIHGCFDVRDLRERMSVAPEPVDELHLRGAQVGRYRRITGLQRKGTARQPMRRLVARIIDMNGAQLEHGTEPRSDLDGNNRPIAKGVGPARRGGESGLVEGDGNSADRYIDLGVVTA
jgi:hypothetical protein